MPRHSTAWAGMMAVLRRAAHRLRATDARGCMNHARRATKSKMAFDIALTQDYQRHPFSNRNPTIFRHAYH